ncbi:uncharacterized protein LOC111914042 [Lactuca sativa]|uniref:uncharacterized protein LOC111914042 n=1 Tax=Lactuca sativa TaxID=4236 RepID=UPI000CADEABA|nr:uncharacterized protein LOC111914042 [Lactuca sativa]
MEFFKNAKVVRLRSHLNKFLVAGDDEKTVLQSRNGFPRNEEWTVERVEGKKHVIRLKNCSSGKYLTPSDEPFLTGLTGNKVVQNIQANKLDTSIEWEPIKEGELVKLRAKGGNFLRGNGGTPPWRNSVTHDIPQLMITQEWVLWDVEVVDMVVLESQEAMESTQTSTWESNFLPPPNISVIMGRGESSFKLRGVVVPRPPSSTSDKHFSSSLPCQDKGAAYVESKLLEKLGIIDELTTEIP